MNATFAAQSARGNKPQAAGKPAISIGFLLLPGFTLTPFSGFVDVLRLAADEGDRSNQIACSWSVIGERCSPVKSSSGVDITPTELLGDPSRFDYIAVCGGLLTDNAKGTPQELAFLRQAAAAGVGLIGVCTGSFTLIEAGLMRGKRCCVSWFHHSDLAEAYPEIAPVSDQLYVVDHNRITCAGGAGAIDLAAFLIEKHCGRAQALKSLHILLVDKARPANAAQPQPTWLPTVKNEKVKRALLLIEQNISPPISVVEIADRLSLSKRQLERLFQQELATSPQKLAKEYRLRLGQWLLSTTDKTITDIGQIAGFADTSHFSREYKKMFGESPSANRVMLARDGLPDETHFALRLMGGDAQ